MTRTPIRWTASPARHGALNTWDGVKLWALALMLIDHAGFFFAPHCPALRALGAGAAPVFLFLIGRAPSQPLRADLIFGFLLLWATNIGLGGGALPLNILFTLLLGRLLMRALERGALALRHPYEWLILFALPLPTLLVFQSGTLGLLFTLSGYLQRRAGNYPPRTRLCFHAAAFVLFGACQWSALGAALPFGAAHTALLIATLAATAALLWRFRLRPIRLAKPLAWAEPGLRFLARHMLWVYALHFGGLQWLTGKTY